MKSKRDTIDIKNIFASEMIYKRVYLYNNILGFPGGAVVKDLPPSAGDSGDVSSIPASGSSPGGGNGNPLQYSFLGKPKDRGAWQATVHGVRKSWT